MLRWKFVENVSFLIAFFLLFLAGADTGFAIYERFTNQNAPQVGFVAHLGGFVSGT